MTKAIKATIKRLAKMAKTGDYRAELLGEIIRLANIHDDLVAEGFDPNLTGAWAFNSEDCIYVRVQNGFDKRVLAGLASRFEKLIDCKFTHGLNECRIIDINKLVKHLAS
jgi:hypothetical protein